MWALMKLPFLKFFYHLSFALSLHSISPHIRGSKGRESLSQWGSCSDVQQMKSKNHGCYLPGCQLFPSLYLVQEASRPSATRVLLGLSVVRRAYFSGLRLTLGQNIPFHLRPMRWLLLIKRSFIWASSNNFTSPPLSAHLPLPSPPPLV